MAGAKLWFFAGGAAVATAALAVYRRTRPARDASNMREGGESKSAGTAVLEAGARLLQPMTPLSQFDVYLAGFHPMKDDPHHQMEAHHFCRQVNEDLMQCILFSGNTADAHLNGIEYIISEKLYETLAEDERPYWHPHNYEILSGTLTAPGLPEAAEHAFMRKKMNSYGKTWHTWNTGSADQPGEPLPLGPALLAWSFNRDGELRECIFRQAEQSLGLDMAQKRRDRADLVESAHPQGGVDALRDAFPDAFPDAEAPPPGVVDKQSAAR